ncbi:hypothetical protein [Oceanithermus desulfurans]|uniref:Uncharacterized protein n=2 Tax=Oceanithermus desulfurans TaxID=227924 RepID=A0A511RNG7_9DEIN|nr:hypothetical protein [Oceanithermus desulfurans]MBB6030790.1 hypothetical protein [Oceanithermus desulfurans]GEM90637.1 hypothetical protein ODE01S_20710 [Oceanithermus desulfurans NBRC 100063]
MENDQNALCAAGSGEVKKREAQIARLLRAIGHPEAWVSDESWLSDFCMTRREEQGLIAAVRREYGVGLSEGDLDVPLWVLVDELERRPRA